MLGAAINEFHTMEQIIEDALDNSYLGRYSEALEALHGLKK